MVRIWSRDPRHFEAMKPSESTTYPRMRGTSPLKEIGILLPNNLRQHRTLHIQKDVLPFSLCKLLCPVSADLASIFRMDSISTYHSQDYGDPELHPFLRCAPRSHAQWDQSVCFDRLDSYHTPPDSDERQ